MSWTAGYGLVGVGGIGEGWRFGEGGATGAESLHAGCDVLVGVGEGGLALASVHFWKWVENYINVRK